MYHGWECDCIGASFLLISNLNLREYNVDKSEITFSLSR